MKRLLKLLPAMFLAILSTFFLHGCLKDTVNTTQRYVIFRPVYKTVQEVRENIKTTTPVAIQFPGKIYIKDKYIFIAESFQGIHILDNSDPASPKNIGFLDIPGNVDMAIKNNTLYADMYSDLLTIDITDPKNAVFKKVTEKVFPEKQGYLRDGLVIASWTKKDTSIYSSGPAVPKEGEVWYGYNDVIPLSNGAAYAAANASGPAGAAGSTYGTGGSMARFASTKDRLYTVGTNNMGIFNITDAFNPSFLIRKDLGWGIETIFPFKENLFVGTVSGVKIFALGNPDNPNEIGSFGHVRRCDPVVANDKFAFVTLRAGANCGGNESELQVLSLESITNPTLIKSYALENPFGLSIDGSALFVCDGTAGLKIYNAADVKDIKLIKQIKDINPYDVIAMNGLAIVVGKTALYQYDYKDLNNIKLLSTTTIKK